MTGFHTFEIQLWRAVNRGQKPLNRHIRALSKKIRASLSEAWATWIVGARASLMIWARACLPKADGADPTTIFAKLGAIWSRRYKIAKD